ncbi:hypothetical protein TW95_gp0831 [Pandoravirus inopinatum]|uniref:Uncharacterized protein n=1 Tax=Pandoravirus inopinatum TaxID=1605721 RepID=A0A0B5J6Y4_9VIRU|nr:hypothetical protein TW95_gp0831 [Pandoravirus inopinatum]AJF97565.1 hypothetical protein [Pandoravirus inopinatum]
MIRCMTSPIEGAFFKTLGRSGATTDDTIAEARRCALAFDTQESGDRDDKTNNDDHDDSDSDDDSSQGTAEDSTSDDDDTESDTGNHDEERNADLDDGTDPRP